MQAFPWLCVGRCLSILGIFLFDNHPVIPSEKEEMTGRALSIDGKDQKIIRVLRPQCLSQGVDQKRMHGESHGKQMAECSARIRSKMSLSILS